MAYGNDYFDFEAYLKGLKKEGNEETFEHAVDAATVEAIAANDPWLSRAAHYGSASAMENHAKFVGGNLLPGQQRKLFKMEAKGVMGESYTRDNWFGTTNEEPESNPHVSEEVPFDQLCDDVKTFIEELENRILRAAVIHIVRVEFHDRDSEKIDQYSYADIKRSAALKRERAA